MRARVCVCVCVCVSTAPRRITEYAGPEQRFCPAKVYEYHENDATGEPELVINAQNCIHCKSAFSRDASNEMHRCGHNQSAHSAFLRGVRVMQRSGHSESCV